MFKILILQAWYGLSDEALEKQIARDLMFRDLCINMNNNQNAIFHQITNFLKTPLALLGVDLKIIKSVILLIIPIYAKVSRDLMFRRFIDLSLSENVPDHSSIWRFRQLLNTEKLLEPLLEQINNHLEQNSIIVSLGSINIIDATVIEAKQSRKRKGKHGNNTQDPEAAYNVKTAADGKRKTTYGFKMHANTD